MSTAMQESVETSPQPRKWTREEYYRAADLGLFRPDEKLELIDGEVLKKVSPQRRPHAIAISKVARALETAFGPTCFVQQQMPLRLPSGDEPEPDLLVVPGSPEDYADHPDPSSVRLLVEVSDTTLRFDQGRKAALYAQHGIPEYWVVNLPERRLDVYRAPAADSSRPYGFAYTDSKGMDDSQTIEPLMAADKVVNVADLLPQQRPAVME